MKNKLVFLGGLLLLTACGASQQTGKNESSLVQDQATPFKTATNLKQTMEWVLDPAADHIWDSAGAIITDAGTEELAPTTDAGWELVRNSAAIVAQSGNLLMLPGIALGENDWMELSAGLVDAGMLALKAAEAQDSDALFKAGGQIYNVCRACHQQYVTEE
jgi:hypothetical protein